MPAPTNDAMSRAIQAAISDLPKAMPSAPEEKDEMEMDMCTCPKCAYSGPEIEFKAQEG